MGILDWLTRRAANDMTSEVRGRVPGASLTGLLARAWSNTMEATFGGSGYLSPDGGNLGNWSPGLGDADADIVRDLPKLRAFSRDLARTSPIAAGAINTHMAHVVGTGLTMQSRINAKHLGLTDEQASEWQANTEQWFELWASSHYADASGRMDWYGLQDLIERSAYESGDCFPLLATVQRHGWPFRMALQVIEADRVSNPDWRPDSTEMVQGVELKDGAPVAVHVADRHPGSTTQRTRSPMTKWTRVPFRGDSGRRMILQHMRHLRPGQSRGVPELAPIIEPIKQLTRYSEAEIAAAVNSATLAVFTKMDPKAFDDLFEDDAKELVIERAKAWDGKIQAGRAVNLLPGEEIQTAEMNRPNPNFGPFFEQVLTQIGMALGIPFEVLARKFNSSFSAARAALLDAWRSFRIRRDRLVSRVCQPVYEEWLADAVALGLISAPGFFSDAMTRAAWSKAKWAGDGPGAIDPEKEARGAQARMDAGLTTLAEEIVAYDGGDWETKHREQTKIARARKEAGLGAQPAPAPSQQPSQARPPGGRTGSQPEPDEDTSH